MRFTLSVPVSYPIFQDRGSLTGRVLCAPRILLDYSMEDTMASGTYFFRSCPTCGRHLNVRIELLGREVECTQCRATFVATEEAESSRDDQRIEQILARAQRYIDSVHSLNPSVAEPF